MHRIVRVEPWGDRGWFVCVCVACGTQIGMSAQSFTREQAEGSRCFICEPVPAHPVKWIPDPADDFRTDADLRAIDDRFDDECREAARMPEWK